MAFWSVEATQPAWAEARSEPDDLVESLEDLMEVEVIAGSKKTACCGLGCVG